MENFLKKNWLAIVLITVMICLIAYRQKDAIKTIFLVNQKINQIEKAKTNIQNLDDRIEKVKNHIEKWKELKEKNG